MSSGQFFYANFPRRCDVDFEAEARAVRWDAAVKRIDAVDLLNEIADTIASDPDPETSPFAPLVREILANPPDEPLGSRYYNFRIVPAVLQDVGRRVQDVVQIAFDRLLHEELDRMDYD